MSATEAASCPRKLINTDRMLLVVLSVLLLTHAGLYYVSLRFNLPFAFVFAWSAASFVLELRLPQSIDFCVPTFTDGPGIHGHLIPCPTGSGSQSRAQAAVCLFDFHYSTMHGQAKSS